MNSYTQADLEGLFNGSDVAKIRSEVLGVDYGTLSPSQAALVFGRFLFLPSGSIEENLVSLYNRTETDYELFVDNLRDKGLRHQSIVAAKWLVGDSIDDNLISEYCIFLFNINYGQTRRILTTFLTQEEKPPDRLHLVIANILYQGFGLSHTDVKKLYTGPFRELAEQINRLFSSSNETISLWLIRKKMSLFFYGGSNRVMLGSLDSVFSNQQSGIGMVNILPAARFDLGGGFGTAEFEKYFNARFVSADVCSPDFTKYDAALVMEGQSENGRMEVLDTEQHYLHTQQQRNIKHLKFDVFLDSFPTMSDSYLIVSKGFLLSARRPDKVALVPVCMNKGKYVRTILSLSGLLRVCELVCLKKTVDLFVIQRTRYGIYKHNTCFAQWRDGRIYNLVTTELQPSNSIITKNVGLIYDRINSKDENFLSYVPDYDVV